MSRTLLVVCALGLHALVPSLVAQQFQVQTGLLPGPVVWSEGVETLDANGDGLLDIIFTNGVGFSSASGALAPTLLIHQGISGVASFADETGVRIPPGFAQQGKGVAVCDVNGDGATDIVFANAFVTQQRILINDGTGVFTDETAARFPTLNLNGFGVAPADVDNDGDIDLVFCDGGATPLGGTGGKPRLLINDGTGVFTDSPARMNGVNKVGAMQISAVDIDGDLDLDIVVDGRSVGQHLYLNDGTGTFSFAGTTVLPVGSTFVYETDWADLDNDGDMDGFYVSMSGFSEGSAQSLLSPSGTLSFVGSTTTVGGVNGDDDNEVAFLDANNDGLLDVVIASLSGAREKLYLNGGTFANGSFAYQATGFTTLTDSSLDLAVADFDQDGRYDVVTAQGESGNFTNRYYKNTGPVDSIAPVLGRLESRATVPVSELVSGAFGFRCWVQDATADSGRTHVHVSATAEISRDGVTVPFAGTTTYSGGYLWRWSPGVLPSAASLVGADVAVTVTATDPANNTTVSSPVTFRLCGVNPYGTPSAVNNLTLSLTPELKLGQTSTLAVSGATANQPGFLVVGTAPANLPLVGGTLLVDPAGVLLIPLTTDASGTAVLSLSIPNDPAFAGVFWRAQGAFLAPSQPLGWEFSSGVEAAICE